MVAQSKAAWLRWTAVVQAAVLAITLGACAGQGQLPDSGGSRPGWMYPEAASSPSEAHPSRSPVGEPKRDAQDSRGEGDSKASGVDRFERTGWESTQYFESVYLSALNGGVILNQVGFVDPASSESFVRTLGSDGSWLMDVAAVGELVLQRPPDQPWQSSPRSPYEQALSGSATVHPAAVPAPTTVAPTHDVDFDRAETLTVPADAMMGITSELTGAAATEVRYAPSTSVGWTRWWNRDKLVAEEFRSTLLPPTRNEPVQVVQATAFEAVESPAAVPELVESAFGVADLGSVSRSQAAAAPVAAAMHQQEITDRQDAGGSSAAPTSIHLVSASYTVIPVSGALLNPAPFFAMSALRMFGLAAVAAVFLALIISPELQQLIAGTLSELARLAVDALGGVLAGPGAGPAPTASATSPTGSRSSGQVEGEVQRRQKPSLPPMPPTSEQKKPSEDAAQMAFQVQWNHGKTAVTFSEVAGNDYDVGVTKTQALQALDAVRLKVKPAKVRDSAQLANALAKAKRYVQQAQGLPEGLSKTFLLGGDSKKLTGGTGARVDVVSIRSPNNLTRS